jgi:hypothetical protein
MIKRRSMETNIDGLIFACTCGVITFFVYASPEWRGSMAGLVGCLSAPLVISGTASAVLNAFGAEGGRANSAVDVVMHRIASTSFMCKVLLSRLFIFLSMIALYQRNAGKERSKRAVAAMAISDTAIDCKRNNAMEKECSSNPACIYEFDKPGGACTALAEFSADEDVSILSTRMYGMCRSYFQIQRGSKKSEKDSVSATPPRLLTLRFVASLLIHIPNGFTGPPILYTTFIAQCITLSEILKNDGGDLDYRTLLSIMATFGEIAMWTWSTMYVGDLRAYTQAIAMSCYIMGNANVNCFLLSIFACVFTPDLFYPKFTPPVDHRSVSLANAGTIRGMSYTSMLDGSVISAEDVHAVSGNFTDRACLYIVDSDGGCGANLLAAHAKYHGSLHDTQMTAQMYCRSSSYTPILMHAKPQEI